MVKKYKPRSDLAGKMVHQRMQDLEAGQKQFLQTALYLNAAIKQIQIDVMDWFTLPPSMRTKLEMKKRVGLLDENP